MGQHPSPAVTIQGGFEPHSYKTLFPPCLLDLLPCLGGHLFKLSLSIKAAISACKISFSSISNAPFSVNAIRLLTGHHRLHSFELIVLPSSWLLRTFCFSWQVRAWIRVTTGEFHFLRKRSDPKKKLSKDDQNLALAKCGGPHL